MNKKIVSGTIALLLSTGALFATKNSMVKEVDGTTGPKVLFALEKFDDLLKVDGYDVKLVNLKKDGKCENPIVFLNGLSGYCGSAGCTMLVLDCIDKGYKVMGKTTVSNRPISLSTTSTNGYKNIKVRVRDTGIVALKHDGKAYTKNASKASKSKTEDTDIMIFDGIFIK